jgi:hypothetical protein
MGSAKTAAEATSNAPRAASKVPLYGRRKGPNVRNGLSDEAAGLSEFVSSDIFEKWGHKRFDQAKLVDLSVSLSHSIAE